MSKPSAEEVLSTLTATIARMQSLGIPYALPARIVVNEEVSKQIAAMCQFKSDPDEPLPGNLCIGVPFSVSKLLPPWLKAIVYNAQQRVIMVLVEDENGITRQDDAAPFPTSGAKDEPPTTIH